MKVIKMYLFFVFLSLLSSSLCAKEKCETCKDIVKKFKEVRCLRACFLMICFCLKIKFLHSIQTKWFMFCLCSGYGENFGA